MDKKNSKLIDKVMAGLDWDSIFEVSKCFKLGVGEGTNAIPGIKRKVFSDTLSKSDIKAELRALLKHVIENDIAEIIYGPWMVFWTNAQWMEMDLNDGFNNDDDEDDEDVQITLELDSTLEVIYSPQRICVIANPIKERAPNDDSDMNRLETMLKKALDSEKYELASKIRDIIILQKDSQE